MTKKALFFIDDVIWVFRDLTRQRPASLFDHPFMKLLRELHDLYGTKTQLNLFCSTDRYYGNDIFTLADMTDAYKEEFEAASGWLKFGFHSRSEFPDYPYINAEYDHIAEDLRFMQTEVCRFASKENLSISTTPHWRPISLAACRALYDGGFRLLSASYGFKVPYEGNESRLPYGHAGRLLTNRQPETALFTREFGDPNLACSLCGYNHISQEDRNRTQFTLDTIFDETTGLHFKDLGNCPVLNVCSYDDILPAYTALSNREFLCYGIHEQYFYPEYYAWQPDYSAKLHLAAKILSENGYEFIFGGDLI